MTQGSKRELGTITIAGRDYAYRTVNDLKGSDGTILNGWYKGDTREIEITSGLSPVHHKEVLVHEIVHGVLRQTGQEPAERHATESLVEALTHGLMSVRINGKPLLR